MKQTPSFSKLEAFARDHLAADRYPNDYHIFKLSRCEICGVVPFGLTIEHHTGSKKGDFKGRILGQCSICGHETLILSYTGAHRQPLRVETPACTCGGGDFYVGECERLEGDEGIMGFFDEGVVVGMCAQCQRNHVLVETD
jgi:ribosomal protein S14